MLDNLIKKLKGKKDSGNRDQLSSNVLSFDLLYQLSYMSVIASAGVPRNQIFEHSARIPCASALLWRSRENCEQS